MSDLRIILADETLGLVLSSPVLHYQADLSAVFAEFARLLRPAGNLVFSPRFTIRSAYSTPDICMRNCSKRTGDGCRNKCATTEGRCAILPNPSPMPAWSLSDCASRRRGEELKLKDQGI